MCLARPFQNHPGASGSPAPGPTSTLQAHTYSSPTPVHNTVLGLRSPPPVSPRASCFPQPLPRSDRRDHLKSSSQARPLRPEHPCQLPVSRVAQSEALWCPPLLAALHPGRQPRPPPRAPTRLCVLSPHLSPAGFLSSPLRILEPPAAGTFLHAPSEPGLLPRNLSPTTRRGSPGASPALSTDVQSRSRGSPGRRPLWKQVFLLQLLRLAHLAQSMPW